MPRRTKSARRNIAQPGDRTGKSVRETDQTIPVGPTRSGRAAKTPRRGAGVDQRVQFSGTDELPRRKPPVGGGGGRTPPLA